MPRTVLIVHGSWHSPNHWAPFRQVLHDKGYETRCPRLSPTTSGLAEDGEVIRAELDVLLNEDKEVIVLAHSYGGMVAVEAIHPEYGRAPRRERGLEGGIIHTIYLCAFLLPVGSNIAEFFASIPPDIEMKGIMDDPVQRLFNDLLEEEQKHWVSELQPSSRTRLVSRVSNPGYLSHPATYLYCTHDKAIPLVVQEKMVGLVREAGAEITTETCDAGHSPYLSQPDTILKLLENRYQ